MTDLSPTRCKSITDHGVRRGALTIELIVSATLLMTVMTFVTSMSFRVNQVWQQINQHRIAVIELSNQLEQLTNLSRDDAQTEIERLQPSEYCARSLHQPYLTGELNDDELGVHVVLKIDWQRRYPAPPVELVGWLVNQDPSLRQKAESSEVNE